MRKLIFLLLTSYTVFAQLSPAISNVYFETSLVNGSNRGATSDAIFDANALKSNIDSPIFINNITTPLINISSLPTTSAGTYDILTRNTSTGVVEKVTPSGTFIQNQLPTATAAQNANFWVSGSGAIGTDSSTAPYFMVNGQSGSMRTIYFRSASVNRWRVLTDDTSESGSNTGSDLRITPYNDSGTGLTDAFFIKRSTGNVLINSTTDSGVATEKLQVNGTIVSTSLKATGLSGTGTRTVVSDASGNLSATTPQPLKYVALISQSGTSAPTATVLENTLGGTVVWSRDSAGAYRATLTGAFTANKTFVSITPGDDTALGTDVRAGRNTSDYISVNTNIYTGGVGDLGGSRTSIEIRVYN